MPELSSKRQKKGHDVAVTAFRVFQEAIGEAEESEEVTPEPTTEERHNAAVILGRKGGKKGGPARANKLSAEQRSKIAQMAAQARWSRNKA